MDDNNRHILRAIAGQLERIADILADRRTNDFVAENDASFIDNIFQHSIFKPILETQIEHMKLSTRTYNCLQVQGIRTICELIKKEASAMLRYKNFGKKCLNELYYKLKLDYGIDKKSFLTKYSPPADDIDSYLKFEKIKRRL